jgi:hypothetical protein
MEVEMAGFQITFFRTALKAGIDPNEAQHLTEVTEDFIVRTVDTANRDLVAQLKTMNGKLDNIDGKFENKVTLSRVQLAAILGIAAIGGTAGPLALKMIGLG